MPGVTAVACGQEGALCAVCAPAANCFAGFCLQVSTFDGGQIGDAGAGVDAGTSDAGSSDAGGGDAGGVDAGPVDAGRPGSSCAAPMVLTPGVAVTGNTVNFDVVLSVADSARTWGSPTSA